MAPPGIIAFCTSISTPGKCIQYLRNRHLLAVSMQCSDCHQDMNSITRNSVRDGECWSCSTCRKQRSIRNDSFFSQSRLTLQDLTAIIYFYALDFQIYHTLRLLPHLSKTTVIDWYNFCRDICTERLKRSPIQLGGDVHLDTEIVELDESLFGKKRKYGRGRVTRQQWVFGLVERHTRKCVLYLVPDRKKTTLLPLIQKTCQA